MPPTRMDVWKARAGRVAYGGAANAVGALGGAVRNKLLATLLQTAGLGVLAQVQTSQVWLGVATGMGLGIPVTQNVGAATARGDDEAIRRTVWTAMAVIGSAVVGVTAVGLVLAPQWARVLLGPHADAALVRWSLVGVAGLAFQGSVQGLFAGRSDVRATLTYAVIGNVAMLAVVAALVFPFGLRGAVIGISCFFPAAILGTLWWHRREYAFAFRPAPTPRFHGPTARAMVKIAITALVMSLSDQGVMLAVRTHYAHAFGYASNGLAQAALALSQQTGAVFYAYLGSYAFGRISGARDAAGIREYTQRQWTALVGAAAVTFAIAMLAAGPLVRLLFSAQFDGARDMMRWTMIGEFAKVAMQAWMFGSLPLGGVRLFAPLGLAYSASFGIGYIVATRLGFGAMSVAVGYGVAGVAGLVVSGIAMWRHHVPLTARGLLVLLGGFALLLTIARLNAPRG